MPSVGHGKPAPEETGAAPAPREAAAAASTRPPVGNGSPAARPRSLITPPPDPAEALYYEGMAAYQHRNWEQALERFSRLKEVQPSRPGLDALLDEVRWFLQLQAAAPATQNAHEVAPGKLAALSGELPRFKAWQTAGVTALAVIGIVALLLFAFQGRLPWAASADRETQELFNRGQARLAVGDYEGAEAAFEKLLELSPQDPEAQLGLARAQRQRTLAQGYAAAEAAIAEEDWEKAGIELAKILSLDPSYGDAQAKADFVVQRQRLAGLYADGSRLYDLAQWAEALAQFEKIRELDNSYRTEAVGEFLFVCYLNAGDALISQARGDVPSVSRAVEYFSRALAIHPRNRLAAEARRQSSLYLEAVKALASGNHAEAQSRLEGLLAEAPQYGQGEAAGQLYALLLRSAEEAVQTGDIPAALKLYAQAQTLPVADVSAAQRGEAVARAITPTPTPRPSPTPSPTSTPPPIAVVDQGPLNLRGGPGSSYPVVGQAAAGVRLQITGRSADGLWLRVCVSPAGGSGCLTGAGQQGWLAARLLAVQGNLAAVAVITPPTLAPATTPRPTATRSPLVTCLAGKVFNVSGATPLTGWYITLQAPDGSARTARTSSSGFYRFSDLIAGAYTVSERLEPGWRAVSPEAATVTVAPAAACVSVDFWNAQTEGGAGGQPPAPLQPSPTPER